MEIVFSMKLDKKVVQRRVDLMEAEGVVRVYSPVLPVLFTKQALFTDVHQQRACWRRR